MMPSSSASSQDYPEQQFQAFMRWEISPALRTVLAGRWLMVCAQACRPITL
jgi:hypothetical protein